MEKKVKTRKGIVISDKMDKTIVVAVNTLIIHPKYKKKYRSTKKFKVHNPNNKYKKGDVVEFIECAPISREKRFKVID